MSDFLFTAILWAVFFIGGFFGGLWRDGRALRKETELRGRIEAQRLLIHGLEVDLKTMRAILARTNGDGLKELEDTAEIYRRRRAESVPGSLIERFNAGVVHGVNAALVQLRGWL